MFFLIPKDKKTLIFYIVIIIFGIILEHYHILETQKVVAIGLLIGLATLLISRFLQK